MIKVLIVDDDFLVRMFLKQLTNWTQAGYEIVGDARNGAEALVLFKQHRPELIITDLCMPGMSGLELIRQVKSEEPSTKVVVLSCHDEFEFVREAMQLGADDYVLKNILDEKELLRQLDAIRVKIEQTTEKAYKEKELQRLARMGTDMLRMELVEQLRSGELTHGGQQKLMKDAGLKGEYPVCAVLMVTGTAMRGNSLQEVCQQYCRTKAAEAVEWTSGNCCIFADVSAYITRDRQQEYVRNFSQGLMNCVHEYLNIDPDVGVSNVQSGDGRLATAVLQAHAALQWCFYSPGVHVYDPTAVMNTQWPQSAARFLNTFAQAVEGCRGEDILTGGYLILEAFQSEHTAPEAIGRWFTRLEMEGKFQASRKIPVNLAACRIRFKEYAENVQRSNGLKEQTGGNRAIETALEFIRLHYSEPISLTHVAGAAHLNPAYLSHLFKLETGVNFSEYLLRCRIGKAKELILSSDKPLNQLAAQAGFFDYRNFCKLFKRETGLRPAEFRNRKI